MRVGFIGLGTMGLPMVQNILSAGYDTYVVSRSRPPIEKALEKGAKEASTPQELIEQVDVVLTCLPLPETVLDVYEGENGLVQGASSGKIVIDHSTVSPQLNQRVSRELEAKGTRFIDAPVSGGPMGAKAGTLTIMCGGDENAFEESYPLLKVFGDYIVHVGETGNGSVIKLINNMLVGVHTQALSEALVMGEKAGVNPSVVYDILKRSSGYSKMLDWSIDAILDREFTQRFSVELLHKDMKLALDLADGLEIPTEVVSKAEEMVGKAKEGHGKEDVSSIIRPLEKRTGVTVKRWDV